MSEQLRGFLNVHPVTQGLSDEELDRVAAQATLVTLRTGELLHRAGKPLDSVYLIHSGRLVLSMEMPNGRRQEIFTMGPGHMVGVLAMLTGEAFAVDCIVDESARLIRFSNQDAQTLAQDIPVLRRNFLKTVGRVLGDQLVSPKLSTPGGLVGCLVMDEPSRELLPALALRLVELGEPVFVLSDRPDRFAECVDAVPNFLEQGQLLSRKKLRDLVASRERDARIFFETVPNIADHDLNALVSVSDQMWWISAADSIDTLAGRMELTLKQDPAWQKKSYLIWNLDRNEQVAPYCPQMANLIRRDFKVWPNNDGPTWTSRTSLERLVHFVRGVQVGLAFGGGAARGMAHLGVIQALEDAGIVFDMISGTSAGVLTGLVYCAGYSQEFAIENFTRDLTPGRLYSWLPGGDSWYLLRKYRSRAWDKMLRKYLNDWRLEQCPIPGFSVTADLVQANQVIRKTGDVVDAILESINLPVLSPPICRDGKTLVDGSVLNVLPADVLVNQGCNFVIGVNVSTNIEFRFCGNTPETPTAKMRTPGIVQTLLRSFEVQDRNMSAVGAGAADFTIEPDVSGLDPASFRDTPAIAAQGEAATLASLPELQQMLHRLDDKLFPI